MLDRETLARRLKAARELAGMKQSALAKKIAADGLGIEDVGRMERPRESKGAPDLTLKHVRSLSRHLGLPEAWFTEPSLEQLFAATAGDRLNERVGVLEEEMRVSLELLERGEPRRIAALRARLDAVRRQHRPNTRPRQEPGSGAQSE